jgi:CheY-like chemotaxis protein
VLTYRKFSHRCCRRPDKAVCTAIQVLLEYEGFEVVVDNGRGAIEAAAKAPINAAIVDIVMPRMDGLETIKAFDRNAPGVPVVAISGFMFRDCSAPPPDFLGAVKTLGAACGLQKPFRPVALLKALESCLSRTRGRLEAAPAA